MDKREMRVNILLLITAFTWGMAFPFQKIASQYLGAFSINAVRFIIASIAIIPVIFMSRKHIKSIFPEKIDLIAGVVAGTVLFLASLLQQAGLEYTTSGKAAFITGLYVVIVPIAGFFMHQTIHFTMWISVVIAAVGMFFLSIDSNFTIQGGDLIVLTGAFFWAGHILTVDFFNHKINELNFALIQFITVGVFSLIGAFITEHETFTVQNINNVILPLAYIGVFSTALGYTLQIIAQKYAKPASTAIILSMEAVFAVICAFAILSERLSSREFLGCTIMFSAMMLAQAKSFKKLTT